MKRHDSGLAVAAMVIALFAAFRPIFLPAGGGVDEESQVTYQAVSSADATAAIASHIQRETDTCALAHLTCLGSSKQDVDSYVSDLRDGGVENVLALRGDRAPGREAIDFTYASDLITHLKATAPWLCVGAACYPEGHVEASDLTADIETEYLFHGA